MKTQGTRAIRLLRDAGAQVTVHQCDLEEGAAETYGESIAAILGVEPERVLKTLIAEVDGGAVVAIVPVSGRLSLKALARAAGGKRAEMVEPARAERLTGYVTGGISPFAQQRQLPTFVDETVELWDSVFVSAGQRGLQLEIAPAELLRLLGVGVSDIAG